MGCEARDAADGAAQVFFQSVDSAFVGLAPERGEPWIPPSAIVFHAGDDLYYYGRIKQYTPIVGCARPRTPT